VDAICLVGCPQIGTITHKKYPTFWGCPLSLHSGRHLNLREDLAHQLPHCVISVACSHSSPLKPVRGDTADIGNAEVPELAAEVECLVVTALVDHGAVELLTPKQVEGIDDVRGEVNVGAGAAEGIRELRAGKQ
jgi:hypothetical protein